MDKGFILLVKKEYNIKIKIFLKNEQNFIEKNIHEICGLGVVFKTLRKPAEFNDIDKIHIYIDDTLLGIRKVKLKTCEKSLNNHLNTIELCFTDKNNIVTFSRKVAKFDSQPTSPEILDDVKNAIIALINRVEEVRVRKPITKKQKEDMYRFRFKQYYNAGKVTEKDFPGKLLVDKFDKVSANWMVTIHDNIIATIRVTIDKDAETFELEEDYGEVLRDPAFRYAEVSRFCVDKFFRGSFNTKFELYAKIFIEVYKYCITNKVEKIILSALKMHRHVYSLFGFRVFGREFKMRYFKYIYVLMIAELDYKLIKNSTFQERFQNVFKSMISLTK